MESKFIVTPHERPERPMAEKSSQMNLLHRETRTEALDSQQVLGFWEVF